MSILRPPKILLGFLLVFGLVFCLSLPSLGQSNPGSETAKPLGSLSDWLRTHMKSTDPESALGVADAAVTLFPGEPNVFAIRGQILARLGKYPEALDDLDRALTLSPSDPEYLAARAALYITMGETATAFDDLDRAIEMGSTDPAIYFLRGAFFLSRLRYDKAMKDFDAALSRQPSFPDALLKRSLCRFALGHPRAARQDIETAMRLAPDNPEILSLYGVILSSQGETSVALAALKRAAEKSPDFSAAYINISYIEYLKGDEDAALAALRKALDLDPGSPYALCNLAEFHIHKGMWAEAPQSIDHCVKIGRANPDFWNELRRYLRGMKLARRAIDDNTAKSLSAPELAKQADALFDDGDFEAAYAPYALALILDPHNPRLLFRMAYTCHNLEEWSHAAVFFNQFLAEAPGDPLAPKARSLLDRMEDAKP